MDNAIANNNDLIAVMTDKQLIAFKAQYKDNPKITAYIDAVLAGRVKEAEELKVKTDFEAKVKGLANLPTPPAGIVNVHMAYKEVETNGKPETIVVDGKPEVRTPKVKSWQWVVTTNHVEQVKRGEGGKSETTSKRAITVYKLNSGKLEFMGNYSAGSKACADLKIDAGAGSANLALTKAGYVVTPLDEKSLKEAGLTTTIKS